MADHNHWLLYTPKKNLQKALLFVLVFVSPIKYCEHLACGKRELVNVLLVYLFVYFACVNFSHFSLPLGVREWLRLVIVAFTGLFYLTLCSYVKIAEYQPLYKGRAKRPCTSTVSF